METLILILTVRSLILIQSPTPAPTPTLCRIPIPILNPIPTRVAIAAATMKRSLRKTRRFSWSVRKIWVSVALVVNWVDYVIPDGDALS